MNLQNLPLSFYIATWTLLSTAYLSSFYHIAFAAEVNNGKFDADRYERNRLILDRVPEYFWNENKSVFHWGTPGKEPTITRGGFQTKGSAGIIPYTLYHGKVYILLSRETWGPDRETYCDLGGAVEAHGTRVEVPLIDTFLYTLIKEAQEESGSLYRFSEGDVFDQAYITSFIHYTEDFYEGFESVIALCRVEELYFTDDFVHASEFRAHELKLQGLCPWRYQEKDDYQWISLSSLYAFLQEAETNVGIFENILCESITLRLRTHLFDVLRSKESLEMYSVILREEPLSLAFVEETYLYSQSIGNKKACGSNNSGTSSPRGTIAIAV